MKLDSVESAGSGFPMSIAEFKQMVQDVRAAKKMIAEPDYSLTEGEKA